MCRIFVITLVCLAMVACAVNHKLSGEVSEMVLSANQGPNDVSVYRVDMQDGHLTAVEESPFRAGAYPMAVAVSPDERYTYVTNQGSDSISGYRLDEIR